MYETNAQEDGPTLNPEVRTRVEISDEVKTCEYTPSRSEALRDYRIEIEFLTIGCIVRVGCKTIPFTSLDEAMKELNAYVKNPIEARKVWNKRFEDYDKQ